MENLGPPDTGFRVSLPLFEKLFGFSQLKKNEILDVTTDGKVIKTQKNLLKAPSREEFLSELARTEKTIQIFSQVTSLLQGSRTKHPDKQVAKAAKKIYKIATKNLEKGDRQELSKEIKSFIAAQMSSSLRASHLNLEDHQKKEGEAIERRSKFELYEKLAAVEGTGEAAIRHILTSMKGESDIPSSFGGDFDRYSSAGKIKLLDASGDDLMAALPPLQLPDSLSAKEIQQEKLKQQFGSTLDVFLDYLCSTKDLGNESAREQANEIRDAWLALSSAPGGNLSDRIQVFFTDLRAGKIGDGEGRAVSNLLMGIYQNVHMGLAKSVYMNLKQIEAPQGVSNQVKFRSQDAFITFQLHPEGRVQITHEMRMINKDHQEMSPRSSADNSYETECRYEITAHHEMEAHVSNLDEWTTTVRVGIGLLPENEQIKDPQTKLFLNEVERFFEIAGYNPYYYERSKKVIV